MDERRKWTRVDCELACQYDDAPEHIYNHPEITSRAVTRDISEGGIQLQVFEFLPVGRRIRMCLELPMVEPIETLVEVSWVSEIPHGQDRYQVGVQFKALAEDQRQAIRLFLHKKILQTIR